jgi:hypothetical protein
MKLIEKTNSSNIQTYLSSNDKEFSCVEIIKNNLFQRLLRYLAVTGISKEEFSNNMSPNLRLKIIKVNKTSEEGNPNLYVGNINVPTVENSIPLGQEKTQIFKDAGVDLPREKLLSARLEELNYSSEDPFRLDTITFSLLLDSSFEDIEFSEIQEGYQKFKDNLYSLNKVSIRDKLKATYILSLNKILKSGVKVTDFPDGKISEIVKDIDDKATREEIYLELKKFLSDPYSRPKLVERSERVLNSSTKSTQESNPIKTWKIVTACVLLILGILAYTKRDSIKVAYSIARESKDMEPSKFRAFTTVLFGSKSTLSTYVNNTHRYKEASFKYNNRDSYIARAKADMDEGKRGMESAMNTWFGRKR